MQTSTHAVANSSFLWMAWMLQVIAEGSDDQVEAAAWLVARIASPAAMTVEADRAAVKACVEFCNALAASEVIESLSKMLLSCKLEHKSAGEHACQGPSLTLLFVCVIRLYCKAGWRLITSDVKCIL